MYIFFCYFFFLVVCINDLERECISCTWRTFWITGVRVPTGIPSSTWCTALLNYHFSHEISFLKSTFRAYITNQRKTLEYFWTAIWHLTNVWHIQPHLVWHAWDKLRVKHCFDRQTLFSSINALVFSKLFYCSSVWSNTTEANLNKIQAVQNSACRIVSGAKKYDHITTLLKEHKWLTIRKQLYLRKAILVFKCMNGMAPGYLADRFVKLCCSVFFGRTNTSI